MFAWFFLSAPSLQQVLGYSPLQVGLSFLPANLIMAAFALGLSAKVVMKFGLRLPIALGLSLAAVGLILVVHSLFYAGFFEDPLTWGVLAVSAAALATPVTTRREDEALAH